MLSLSTEAQAAHDAHRPGGPHHARCHAPFTSMYFDQFGNVLACCINTVQPMGSYPKQRVADIWRGIAARNLREALARDDFSMGCHDCHSSISSGNFDAVNALFDQQAASTSSAWLANHPPVADDHRDPWPRLLEFSLSIRCNLTCTMCSGYCSSAIRKAEGQEPLPEPYGDAFVAEIRPFLEHVEAVKFYGGEPFLSPVNFAIWEALEELNPSCEVSITTNGTIWNERVRRVAANLNTSITVSIDAFEADTFESIRRGADHAKVLENLDRFAQIEGCRVNLAVCAMQQNWREIPSLVRFANERDWPLGFNVVRYPQDHSLSSTSAAELADVVGCWEAFLDEAAGAPGSGSGAARQNLSKFGSILAEARGWLAAAGAEASGIEIRTGSAAEARRRRQDWLELVADLASSSWDPLAVRTEAGFGVELERLLAAFDRAVPDDQQGARLARALAVHVDGPLTDEATDRFARLGATFAASSVVHRIGLLAGLPPALLAQTAVHEDPDVLALRLNSYFPPLRPSPAHPPE